MGPGSTVAVSGTYTTSAPKCSSSISRFTDAAVSRTTSAFGLYSAGATNEGNQPSARELIDRGEFLRQHHGIPSGNDEHARPELQPARPPRDERHHRERVGYVQRHPLREPDGVPPERLTRVDDAGEPRAVHARR